LNEAQHILLKQSAERLALLGRATLSLGFEVSNELEPSYLKGNPVIHSIERFSETDIEMLCSSILHSSSPCKRKESFYNRADGTPSELKNLPEFVKNFRYIPITDEYSMFGAVFLFNQSDSYLRRGLFDASPFVAASVSLFRSRRQTAYLPVQSPVEHVDGSALVDAVFKHTYHPVIVFNDSFKVLKSNEAAHNLFKQNMERGWRAADTLIRNHLPSIAEEVFSSIGRVSFLQHLEKGDWENVYFFVNKHHSVLIDVCLFQLKMNGRNAFCLMFNEKADEPTEDEQAKSSIQRFNALTAMLPVAIIQVNESRECTYANESWAKYTGYTHANTLGTGWMACFPQGAVDQLFSAVLRQVGTAERYTTEVRLTRLHGDDLWVSLSAVGIFTERYEFSGAIISLSNITETKHVAHRLEQKATTDPLTGLSNRAAFHDRLDLAIQRSFRHGAMALLFIDLDKFKQINDTYGHAAGDHIIVTVAKRFQDTVRREDSIARLGGDEFAIILADVKNNYVLSKIATKLVDSIALPVEYEDKILNLSCSIGIATGEDESADRKEMLRRADLALYKAKESGRNQHRFYDVELEQNVFLVDRIKADLSERKGSDFSLAFQPKFNTESQQLCGFEIITHWQNTQFPDVGFTGILEKIESSGVVGRFNDWLFHKVASIAKAIEEKGILLNDTLFGFNLSAKQIQSADLSETIIASFIELNLNPKNFQIEVSEEAFMGEESYAEHNFAKLKQIGFRIAIDHFGAGYSSLNILKKLALDKVKLDASLLQNILTNEERARWLETLISIGKMLNITVAAEGVGDLQTSEWLSEKGCVIQQGTLFYDTVNQSDMENLLVNMNKA
jgi:diguanylate cyclase (GGDEF)-like protein/PAS domain S-box-containing protein